MAVVCAHSARWKALEERPRPSVLRIDLKRGACPFRAQFVCAPSGNSWRTGWLAGCGLYLYERNTARKRRLRQAELHVLSA